MIFGSRKKRQAEAAPSGGRDQAVEQETPMVTVTAAGDDYADVENADLESAASTGDVEEAPQDSPEESATTEDGEAGGVNFGSDTDEDTDDVDDDGLPEAAEAEQEEIDVDYLDAQDWRTEGPWDESEVDMEEFAAAVDVPRIDLGSLILTGTEGMDVQLQVAEETQQIVSAMMLLGEQVTVDDEVHELGSALEVAAFAAPRSGGFWPEIREELIEAAEEAGGNAGLVEGPFGVEVRRLLLIDTPDGEQGYQPSRMWVAEGPRWILRGVVYGHAALEGVPGGHAERVEDLFRKIVVRRGDEPMAPGDLLTLRLPENMVEEATEES